MIGAQTIDATLQPRIGDRDDYSIRIIGPGDTDYTFSLSITRTLLSIWGGSSKTHAKQLTKSLFHAEGTASRPPETGFWFDSYNAADTLKKTQGLILTYGINPFVKGGVDEKLVRLFGADLFQVKDKIDGFFTTQYGKEFFRSFEDAFEESQVIDDLNTPAIDHAHFVYRICILAVFIDHFNVRLSGEDRGTGSLKALNNWLSENLDEAKARALTETFARVKDLRKQYPIHENFSISTSGMRSLRPELVEARHYFDLTGQFDEDWRKVSTKFQNAIGVIIEELS
jgi:hypothetical protein